MPWSLRSPGPRFAGCLPAAECVVDGCKKAAQAPEVDSKRPVVEGVMTVIWPGLRARLNAIDT